MKQGRFWLISYRQRPVYPKDQKLLGGDGPLDLQTNDPSGVENFMLSS